MYIQCSKYCVAMCEMTFGFVSARNASDLDPPYCRPNL